VRVTGADGSQDLFNYSAEDNARQVEGTTTSARLLCLESVDAGAWTKIAEAAALR
jgi:hypothetical protein